MSIINMMGKNKNSLETLRAIRCQKNEAPWEISYYAMKKNHKRKKLIDVKYIVD